MKKKSIRVLLADDHQMVLAGFVASLKQYDHIDVVGEIYDLNEIKSQYQKLKPDILILDIKFGAQMNGLECAKDLIANDPEAKIVFLSQFDQDQFVKQAYKLGGRAFMTKNCTMKELVLALEHVHEGEIYFYPDIAKRLASLAIHDSSPQSVLNERELEVFLMIAKGLTQPEIAEQTNLSSKTISNITQVIKEKLNIKNQTEMTFLAIKHNLISV